MSEIRYFERLLEVAGLIARHADYPGKQQVVKACREEVDELPSRAQSALRRPQRFSRSWWVSASRQWADGSPCQGLARPASKAETAILITLLPSAAGRSSLDPHSFQEPS